MTNHLERAHEELSRAEENAGRTAQEQLQTIDQGIIEETDGDMTQSDPGPKNDRLAELEKKLDGLADEVEEPTASHIERALEHLDEYRQRWADDE